MPPAWRLAERQIREITLPVISLSSRDFSGVRVAKGCVRLTHLVVLAAGLAVLTACARTPDVRGHVPDPVALAQVRPAMQSREQVEKLLGSPSSVAVFNGEVWYYIGARTETFAFYRPKVLERQVIAIVFDASGIVKEVHRYGLEDGQEITPVARVTPTHGKRLGLLEQLLGNLGRFATRE